MVATLQLLRVGLLSVRNVWSIHTFAQSIEGIQSGCKSYRKCAVPWIFMRQFYFLHTFSPPIGITYLIRLHGSIRVLWWYPDAKWVPIMAQYIESLHTSFISRTVREISLSRLYFTWMKRKTNKNRQQPIDLIFSFCFFHSTANECTEKRTK